MALPVMAIGAIVSAIVSAAVGVGTAAAGSAPRSSKKYRRQRIKELGGDYGTAAQGLTPEQEDELRVLGIDKFHQLNQQLASGRADEMASVPGGATARDVVLASDRDARQLQTANRAIENQIRAEDQKAKEAGRQELNWLTERKNQEQMAATNQAVGAIGGAATDIAGIAMNYNRAQSEGVTGQANGSVQLDLSSPAAQKMRGAGFDDDTITQFLALPEDQQAEVLSMF